MKTDIIIVNYKNVFKYTCLETRAVDLALGHIQIDTRSQLCLETTGRQALTLLRR